MEHGGADMPRHVPTGLGYCGWVNARGASELEFAAEGGVGGIDAAIDAAEHNPYG